jgi:hypothetical protein
MFLKLEVCSDEHRLLVNESESRAHTYTHSRQIAQDCIQYACAVAVCDCG